MPDNPTPSNSENCPPDGVRFLLGRFVNAPRFPLGRLVATPNALGVLTQDDILPALGRHLSADWGDLDEQDKRENDRALHEGSRLLSRSLSSQGVRFWIITEWDRSVTTVLLPEDY